MIDDDDGDELEIGLTREALDVLETIRDRMGHDSIAATIKHAIGFYDLVSERNMGPGIVHVGVLDIDHVPTEQVAIRLR